MIEQFNRDITAGRSVLVSKDSVSVTYINDSLIARLANYFRIWGPTPQESIDKQLNITRKYCKTTYP